MCRPFRAWKDYLNLIRPKFLRTKMILKALEQNFERNIVGKGLPSCTSFDKYDGVIVSFFYIFVH